MGPLLPILPTGPICAKVVGRDRLDAPRLAALHRGREDYAMPDDRNGGKPPLDEVLDALKDIYLVLRHSSRSKRTLRQTRVLRRCYIVLGDCGIAVPQP